MWISNDTDTVKRKTYLSTSFTHMRFLASVDALMDGQSRTLNKLLATVRVLAHVRSNTAVDTLY